MSFHSGMRPLLNMRKAVLGRALPQLRILVVDDQSILRCAIAEELALAGYEVAQAEDATEAIAMIGGGATYELLLTDVDMPGPFNGLQLADFTKYVSPQTRVIVMSGACHEIEHPGSIDLLVKKPIPSAELRRNIAELLRSGASGAASSSGEMKSP